MYRRLEVFVAGAAALLAAALLLIATADPGPFVSPDSVAYLATAENLTAGQGLVSYGHELLVVFPPGFPAVIAILSWALPVDALAAARIVGVTCLGATVILGFVLLRRHVNSPIIRLIGVAAMATSSTLYFISTAIWSEPLFGALVLAGLLLVEKVNATPTETKWMIAAALVGSAAFFVRYAGLTLIAAGALAILVGGSQAALKPQRFRRAATYSVVALAGPVIWVTRNLIESSTAFGDRMPSSYTLPQVADQALSVMSRWLLPDHRIASPTVDVVIFVVVVLSVAVLAVRSRPPPGLVRQVLPLAIFTVIYVLFIVASASSTEVDRLDNRLLSPVYVPALVLGLVAVETVVERVRGRRPLTAALALGALTAWLFASMIVGVRLVRMVAANGEGYTDDRWRQSELIALTHADPPRPPVFSNRPDAMWFLAGVDAQCWPSVAGRPDCSGFQHTLEDVVAALEDSGSVRLAMFSEEDGSQPELVLPDTLRARTISTVADGKLYAVTKRP